MSVVSPLSGSPIPGEGRGLPIFIQKETIMSKQVQPAFFDLHAKGVDSVAKAGSNLGGDPARASWHGYFSRLDPSGAKP